jgi:hypothetical protein
MRACVGSRCAGLQGRLETNEEGQGAGARHVQKPSVPPDNGKE